MFRVYDLYSFIVPRRGLPYTDGRRRGCSGGREMVSVDSCPLTSGRQFILKAGAEDGGSRCRDNVVTPYKEYIIQYHCIHSLPRGRTDGVFSDIMNLTDCDGFSGNSTTTKDS